MEVLPRGSKYPIFEISVSINHTLNASWDQRSQILGTWTRGYYLRDWLRQGPTWMADNQARSTSTIVGSIHPGPPIVLCEDAASECNELKAVPRFSFKWAFLCCMQGARSV